MSKEKKLNNEYGKQGEKRMDYFKMKAVPSADKMIFPSFRPEHTNQ